MQESYAAVMEVWIQMLWEQNLDLESNITKSLTPSEMAKRSFHYIQHIGHYVCQKGYKTTRKGYDSFLIICTIKGKGYLKYRNILHEVDSSKVLFIDCNEYQDYYTDASDLWDFVWIHINGANTKQYFENIMQNGGPILTVNNDRNTLTLIESIFELIMNDDLHIELKAPQIIVSLLTELTMSAQMKGKNSSNLTRVQAVKVAVEYIRCKFSETVTVSGLADLCNYTPFYFIKLFKSAMGYSPYEYLTKYRISVAKELLITTDYSIDKIADAVGMKNPSAFFASFKKYESMTPLKYRQCNSTTRIASIK